MSIRPGARHRMSQQPLRPSCQRGGVRAAGCAAVFLIVVACGCSSPPVTPQGSLEAFTGHLDERVPQLMERYDIPGVGMALVRDGRLAWTQAYGVASREEDRPLRTNAIFRAESLSKPVTAWGVLRLVEQGRVDLDAPVEQYLGEWELPESRFEEREVTVRRLLSNSAGAALGTVGEEYRPWGKVPPLRTYLSREVRLAYKPGSEFRYSNAGFNLLELLVEEVTGREFAAYMADEVLTPLGMERARFAWEEEWASAVPTGYDLGGTAVPTYVYPGKASGGLFASVEDIARFAAAGMTGPYARERGGLGREDLRALYAPQVEVTGLFGVVADAYGLGHFVERLPTGQTAVWHGGQGHGWMTHFHSVPKAGEGIVILTNSQRSWPFIAQVLSDWARWNGFGSVKMGRIIDATVALRVLIGLILLVSLWGAYRLVRGLLSGRRTWAPLSGPSRGLRLLQGALGLGGIALLTWGVAQPYLMVASIFPTTIGWAVASLLAVSIILVLLASLPAVKEQAAFSD